MLFCKNALIPTIVIPDNSFEHKYQPYPYILFFIGDYSRIMACFGKVQR